MSGGRVVPDVLAAVDLGSNSFHMVVARHSHGQLVILDRLREMVRLAAGLGDSGRLDDSATERALRCLERFGQRLRAMQADSVRVVGTNALRRAKRKRWFLERARAALEIAAYTSVLVSGSIRMEGQPGELLDRQDFEELFLGAATSLSSTPDSEANKV